MRLYTALWLVVALLAAPLPALAADKKPDDGLSWILPGADKLEGLKPAGKTQQAVGEDLYKLINGGAGLYLEHGFQRALAQDYKDAGGVRFSLEVYQMKAPAGAKKIFEIKGGNEKNKKPIGEASTLEEYYGLFQQGRFYFTVTASRTKGTLIPSIKAIARGVVAQIVKQGDKPM